MKKYFIAAMVALAVFAMSAFAAELTVDGGVIQAGSDADLTCTEAVTVEAYGTETSDMTVRDAKIRGLEHCDGNKILLQWKNSAGNVVENGSYSVPVGFSGIYDHNFEGPDYPSIEEVVELVVVLNSSQTS